MPHDLMTKCAQKKPFMVNGKRVWKWVAVEVTKVVGSPLAVRCVDSHGAVRLHKQRVKHGPKDHVEHLSRQDSTYCIGDMHYKGGEIRISTQPVE